MRVLLTCECREAALPSMPQLWLPGARDSIPHPGEPHHLLRRRVCLGMGQSQSCRQPGDVLSIFLRNLGPRGACCFFQAVTPCFVPLEPQAREMCYQIRNGMVCRRSWSPFCSLSRALQSLATLFSRQQRAVQQRSKNPQCMMEKLN